MQNVKKVSYKDIIDKPFIESSFQISPYLNLRYN